MYNVQTKVTSVAVETHGNPKIIQKIPEIQKPAKHDIKELHTTAILGTVRVLR